MIPQHGAYERKGPAWCPMVPSHWGVAPLFTVGHESTVKNDGMAESNLLSLSFGRIVRKNIAASEGLLPASFETYQIVDSDDVVFRLTDLQNDQRSLRSGLVPERGIITSAYVGFTPTGTLPRYFSYLMRGYDLQKAFYGMGGGLRQSLRYEDIRRMRIMYPPWDEQRRIAHFLDRETAQIDALIEKQEALFEGLRARQAASIAEHIDVPSLVSGAKLKHHVAAVRQGWSPQCNSWPAAEDSWAVLRTGCANRGVFDPHDNKQLPEGVTPRSETVVGDGELIVSRANTRELVGSAAVVHGSFPKLMLSDKHYSFRLRSTLNPDFAAVALRTRSYRDLIELEATGASSSMQNITRDTFLNLPMNAPNRNVQDRLVAVVSAELRVGEHLIATAEQLIGLASERRAALITAAVTGQLDVNSKEAV